MRILVTGGAGFIGSHLVDASIAAGHEVVVIDNFSTGKREHLNPNANLVEADIRDLEAIASHLKGAEVVFHTAALARVQPSIENPVLYNAVNVDGTLNVLVASRDAKVKRVVFSSSSSVYGDQKRLPLQEDMQPKPKNPYGLQKYIGECYCRLFSELYGLQTVSLRYFNVYGPRANLEGAYALVIGKFITQRLEGRKLTVYGDGTQTRDFTHVRDVVRANLLAAESQRVGFGETVNIGGGKNISVLKIANAIGGEIEFLSARAGEPHDTLADNSRARELLGWAPEVDFGQGMQEVKALYLGT